jgi:hypothetical protein
MSDPVRKPTRVAALAAALCTDDRRRIWAALRNGDHVFITPEQRAVNRETGEDLGSQIAAQEILFAGLARWRRGADWVLEIKL